MELVIVTAGILIALSLEGLREWSQHRSLLHEARENLANEMRNNRNDVQMVLKSVDATMPRLIRAIELAGAPAAQGRGEELAALFAADASARSVLADFTISWLNTASYTTAEISGALALMEYDEIRKYSEIYDAQALFSRTQDAAMRDAMVAYTVGAGLLANPSANQIDDIERRLRESIGGLLTLRIMANTLNGRYAKALGDASAAQ